MSAWLGMKILWQRLIQMLRCWKVLVPLKSMNAFEEVVDKTRKDQSSLSTSEQSERRTETMLEEDGRRL
jgi:hypothetical protein